jgi:hypothetical protein
LIERKTDIKLRLSRNPENTISEEFKEENSLKFIDDEKNLEKKLTQVRKIISSENER